MGWTPFWGLIANQEAGGTPKHTEWDVYAEQHNPLSSFIPILNTPDYQNGAGMFTNYSEVLGFRNPLANYVYTPDQNYEGVAPMELQPLLNLPNPWEA